MDKSFFKKIKKERLIVIVLSVIVVVIFLSSFNFSKTNDEKDVTQLYVESVEEKVKEAVLAVNGVKRVKVVITVSGAIEKIYQTDEKTVTEGQKKTVTVSTVFSSGKPIEIGNKYPQIIGVVVICGIDDFIVKSNVMDVVKAITDLPCEKIKIL